MIFPHMIHAHSSLMVVYPPDNHQTTAHQIFLLGTAPSDSEVYINGKIIAKRKTGHFAPSFPLVLGENIFLLRHQNQEITIKVTRIKPPESLDVNTNSTNTVNQLEVVEVIAKNGVARTGPSTDYSRLTPLPRGTQAAVTAKQGEWWQLDYGGWITATETRVIPRNIAPYSTVGTISSKQKKGATEIIFPLRLPIPLKVQQKEQTFILTFYNTIAKTDLIQLNDDPLIKRLDWQQVTPTQVEYTFNLKSPHQWGYDLHYQGNNLVLSLRHPPQITTSLKGISILLDPGHGGEESGAKGPNGYPEKDVNLIVAQLLAQELEKRGAIVYITRKKDEFLSLQARVDMIDALQPTLAISIHYNAPSDSGDAANTKGVGAFWYHPQAHSLAVFLQQYLVEKLDRASYGVYWSNLALTRPHTVPAILLELGFITNPEEFEWITNSIEQRALAVTLAEGISEWFEQKKL